MVRENISFYLKVLFSSYGHVVSSKAIIDQKTGLCKGYGFVMYEKEEECLYAIEELNKKGLQASFARVGQVRISNFYANS